MRGRNGGGGEENRAYPGSQVGVATATSLKHTKVPGSGQFARVSESGPVRRVHSFSS